MRRPIQILFIALAAVFASASAMAGGGGITVGLNESRRIMLSGDAATVVVGDPKVADVTMMDSHSVIVMGRGYGTTQLIVTDHSGRTLLARAVTVPEYGHVTFLRGVEASEYGCSNAMCRLQGDPTGPRGGGSAGPGYAQPGVSSSDQEDTTMTVTTHRTAFSGASPSP